MAPRYYHFSVDDVLTGLAGLRPAARSPTESWLLDFCSGLHETYNAHIDLYLFQQEVGFSLSDLPAELSGLFSQLEWLRFGPHALDRDTPPHSQTLEEQAAFLHHTYREIARFAGLNRVSAWVRLHYFSECFEQVSVLNQYGTIGLFTTDKPAVSYRLPSPQIEELRRVGQTVYGNCELVRSHVRIENLVENSLTDSELDAELTGLIGDAACAVIFTHEYELERPEVRDMTHQVFRWIHRRNLEPLSSLAGIRRSSPHCFDEASSK